MRALLYISVYNRFLEVFANFTVFRLASAGYIPHLIARKLIQFALFIFIRHIAMVYKPITDRKETSPGKRRAVWTRHLDGHGIPAIMRLCDLRTYLVVLYVVLLRELSFVVEQALNRSPDQGPLKLQQLEMTGHSFEL